MTSKQTARNGDVEKSILYISLNGETPRIKVRAVSRSVTIRKRIIFNSASSPLRNFFEIDSTRLNDSDFYRFSFPVERKEEKKNNDADRYRSDRN